MSDRRGRAQRRGLGSNLVTFRLAPGQREQLEKDRVSLARWDGQARTYSLSEYLRRCLARMHLALRRRRKDGA